MGLEQLDDLNSKPLDDELEVTLVGPGWGECALLHLGGSAWAIVDSCLDNSAPGRSPAALSYLDTLQVNLSTEVKLILCTHWHDDHISGLSKIVERCREAIFCCSSAIRSQEFFQMVRAYQKGPMIAAGSGIGEIDGVFALLRGASRPARLAIQDRVILRLDGAKSGHGMECLVWSLSPSDMQVTRFLGSLSLPRANTTKARCDPMRPNHQTAVIWIEIGETKILLGGDLEETEDQETGWSVIVNSATRPRGRAAVFKIPHHGSKNGHCEEVWNEMLMNNPFAILTPWNRGSKLPTTGDVARITVKTSEAYSTSRLSVGRRKGRPPAVEKTLRELGVTVRHAEPDTGILRLRKRRSEPWRLQRFGGACHLSEVHSNLR